MNYSGRIGIAVFFAILMVTSLVAMPIVAAGPDRSSHTPEGDAELWPFGVEGSSAWGPVDDEGIQPYLSAEANESLAKILEQPPNFDESSVRSPAGDRYSDEATHTDATNESPATATITPITDTTDRLDTVEPSEAEAVTALVEGVGADARTIALPDHSATSSAETIHEVQQFFESTESGTSSDFDTVSDETTPALNRSLEAYRSPNYVESDGAFEGIVDAHDGLLRAQDGSDTTSGVDRELEMSDDLVSATDTSVRLAVVDAARTVDRHGEAFDDPVDRGTAEFHLGVAITALDWAAYANEVEETDQQSASTERAVGLQTNVQAVELQRIAWKHAERAVDVVETSTTGPSLEVSTGTAFETDGSVMVPVSASLADVRPHAYEDAEVVVDGDEAASLDIHSTGPATSPAAGSTLIEVDPADVPTNVTITVETAHGDVPERTASETKEVAIESQDVHWERPDPDEQIQLDVEDDETAVSVEARGQGLARQDIEVHGVATDVGVAATGQASPMVRIQNQTDVDEATISLPIDDTAAASTNAEEDLRIFTYDPRTDDRWRPLDTDVDTERGVATTEVETFSYYAVKSERAFTDSVSDQIPLEDHHVDGELDDIVAATTERDGVIVKDTGESMYGYHYYGITEALFVYGAFYDDPHQVASVSFNSSSYLHHGLTDEDGVLHETFIPALPAGGQSNIASGLSEGLSKLDEAARDDADLQMLLVSDGKNVTGADPLTKAEEAAQAGVEITVLEINYSEPMPPLPSETGSDGSVPVHELSSSGVPAPGSNSTALRDHIKQRVNEQPETSARAAETATSTTSDSETLEQLADLTGGDHYRLDNRSALWDTLDELIIDTELKDTSDDGIPDAVADMDLAMPAGDESVVGQPIELDPATEDTSGDGIADADTIDLEYEVIEQDGEPYLEATVTSAEHNPSKIDTTGDGLTDREQVDGWEIEYTSSATFTNDFMEALEAVEAGEKPPEDLQTHLTTKFVDNVDPAANETYQDGISDADGFELGIDPTVADTTGDRASDADMLEYDRDPTLFDVQGPEIVVLSASYVDNGPHNPGEYEVTYEVSAPVGVDEVAIRHDGSVEDSHETSDQPPEVVQTTEFETSRLDDLLDAFMGAETTVWAADRNGFESQEVALDRPDVFGALSEELAEVIDTPPEIERHLGQASGMTTGTGETAEFLYEFAQDPQAYAEAMTEILDHIDDIEELIAQLPQAIRDQQESNNRHEPGTEEHEQFRAGWYEGYLFWFIVESVVPVSKAADAVRTSERLGDAVDTVTPSQVQSAALMVGETVAAPYRLAQVRLSNAIHTTVGVGHDVAHAALGPARSAVTQLHAATHARHLDDSTLRVMADGSGDTNDAFVRGVYRAADDDSVSSYGQIDRAVERVDDLDGAAKTRAKRLVADTDGDEIWLIDDIDSSTLERVTGLNIERADELRAAFATKRSQGHADLDDFDAFAEYVDSLEGVTGLNSGPVDDFIRAGASGDISGAVREVQVANRIGADTSVFS